MAINFPEIQLGRINILPIVKKVEFGYYLGGSIRGHIQEILLPNREVVGDIDVNSQGVPVFLYLDQEELLVATMHQPQAQVGDFACLEVSWVNNFGAFLSWGPQKDLFVPFREQKQKMQKGRRYIVHVHLDDASNRIVASAKVERWLSQPTAFPHRGTQVQCLVWQKTDIGFKVIVNFRSSDMETGETPYSAVLYDTQIFRHIQTGDVITAFVSKVRQDGKIDLTLQRQGQDGAEDFSQVLLNHLQTNGGQTVLCDKSPAEEIYAMFGVSKKVFKRAVGDLYKKHLIQISDNGLELL